ncbi:DUF2490 domain-containing protein [Spongiimicrobium sp. 2-473A-2-J]|uniref:DUF2490 domain-containing protein n=1 Tax=Eudoraea algarum TaxID=3417568 RepID=UPI003D35DA6C
MKKIILLLMLCFLGRGLAQETGENSFGAWYMYFGTNKISKAFSIHSEAQFRFYESTGNFNQLLLRTGLNYHIDPNSIVTFGYGYIDTDPTFEDSPAGVISAPGDKLVEHRIFEQLILKNKVGEFLFEHRYRLEQRFLNNKDLSQTDTQHRARYRLQVTLPLTDTFFINVYDEVFLNLQDDIFGQNRLYAALGVHLTHNSSIQLGYLKNHFNSVNFDRLQIGVFFNPDLRRTKAKQ